MKDRFALKSRMLEEAYQEIAKFFNFNGEICPIRIEINPNMPAMCKENNTIRIPKLDIELIKHEIAHLIYGYSKFPNLSLWNEGIAEYFRGGGNCNNKINFDITDLKGGTNLQYDYGVGCLLICCIIKQFGNSKKIIAFLNHNEEDLLKRFTLVFGLDVNALIQLQGGKNQNGPN
jgi:hypothetical protein